MSAVRPIPLLICSIGNPGSTYANTLHSAGHNVVQLIAEKLGFPQFRKDRTFGNGMVSQSTGPSGAQWTLWQSTSYMNESGPGVRSAWKAWSNQAAGVDGKIVIVHDELEKPIGDVSVKSTAGGSARGHNGLKSIKAVMGEVRLVKLGIGIGRPVSRESEDVARYVLRKMTSHEKDTIIRSTDEASKTLSQLN